jgi:hypothetical protein
MEVFMTVSMLSPRILFAALALSTLGLVATDSTPAEAVVVCRGNGCVAGRPVAVAPVAVAGPVGVGRVGVGVGAVGVGAPGVGRGGVNRGGPVNRVGVR